MSASISATLAMTLEEGCAQLGVPIGAQDVLRLDAYLDLIIKWNAVHNLTAIREKAKMVTHHLLDSLAVAPHLPAGRALLDIGSGAGLPGIPLAIARPDLRVTVLDSNKKKTAFLQQAVATLALANVAVVAERAEAFTPAAPFDAIISRAFAELADFALYGLRHLAPGGVLLAMKGVYPNDELARLPANARLQQVIELHIPGLGAHRHLVLLEHP